MSESLSKETQNTSSKEYMHPEHILWQKGLCNYVVLRLIDNFDFSFIYMETVINTHILEYTKYILIKF